MQRVKNRPLLAQPVQTARKAPLDPKYEPDISALADSLLSSITVSPIKDSSVVIVSIDARDPTLAADIVNTLAAEYIQMNFENQI